ncbi:unnamed protein product [Heterobilharzia americana]|nr:unnamed protein product [Heterobilharzia americana]
MSTVDINDTCQCKRHDDKHSTYDMCTDGDDLSKRPFGIPVGAKTSEYYRTDENLPGRFNNPDKFGGYEGQKLNPLYRTTNSEYGRLKPNVHTMNVVYHSKKQDFSKVLW